MAGRDREDTIESVLFSEQDLEEQQSTWTRRLLWQIIAIFDWRLSLKTIKPQLQSSHDIRGPLGTKWVHTKNFRFNWLNFSMSILTRNRLESRQISFNSSQISLLSIESKILRVYLGISNWQHSKILIIWVFIRNPTISDILTSLTWQFFKFSKFGNVTFWTSWKNFSKTKNNLKDILKISVFQGF